MQTKYFLSMFIFLSVNITTFSQSFSYDKAWKSVNHLEKKALPNQAFEATAPILEAADKEHNNQQLIRVFLRRADLRQAYQEDALVKTIKELESYETKLGGAEKAMLQIALAEAYTTYFRENQWTIRELKMAEGAQPKSIKQWSTQHFLNKTDKLFGEALSAKLSLQQCTTSDWKEVFLKNEKANMMFDIQPTLYDFALWKAINYYQQDDLCNIAKEEAFVLNNPIFLQSDKMFSAYIVPKPYIETHKAKLIQAFQALVQAHKHNTIALLYTEDRRLQYFRNKVIIEKADTLLLKTYKTLYEQHQSQKGAEWIAQSYISLLSTHQQDEVYLQKAATICKYMMQQQPKQSYFKEKWEQLHQPLIEMDFGDTEEDNVFIPQQANLLYVKAKNVNKLWFRIIPLSPNDALFSSYNRQTINYKKYSKHIALTSFSHQLWDNKPLSIKKVLLSLPSLDYGAYAILVSNQENFNDKEAYLQIRPFWVSNIRLLAQNNKGEYMLINRKTGQFIADAKIKVYKQKWRGPAILVNTLQSDSKGVFKLLTNANTSLQFKISKGKDYWQSGNVYNRVYKPNNKAQEKHYLFTDRAIYRPGQRVYFKAILTSQQKDSIRLLANEEVKIYFYSTQGKEIGQKNLRTNAYGSANGYFDCPTNGLNGNMRISTSKASTSLRMEAYKRPKFQIEFNEPKVAMRLGEMVKVDAKVTYFMGTAVTDAKVKYRVERQSYTPWWRTYYHMPMQNQDMPIAAGEVQTNDKGNFTILFTAEAADKHLDYRYKIIAEVMDASGEVQQQDVSYIIGEKAMYIHTDMPKVIDKFNTENLKVHINNLQSQPLTADWQINIEQLAVNEKYTSHVQKNIDKILIGEFAQAKDFPSVCFDTALCQPRAEKEVYKTIIKAKAPTEISASLWQNLPIGNYRCTLSATDAFGQKVTNTYDMVLIASDQKAVPPMHNMQLMSSKNSLEVGDNYRFILAMPNVKSPLYYRISSGQNIIAEGWKKNVKSYTEWVGNVLPAYRGGLTLQVFYAQNGDWHQASANYIIPYENKNLDIQLETFRSAIEPGKPEQWQVKITDHNKKAVVAELMAAMYDKSLDALVPHQWQWQLFPQKQTLPMWKSLASYLPSWNNISPIYPQPLAHIPLLYYNWSINNPYSYWGGGRMCGRANSMYAKNVGGIAMDKTMAAPMAIDEYEMEDNTEAAREIPDTQQTTAKPESTERTKNQPALRKNLEETAFFYPQLQSNAQGEVQISFQAPEALTEWKLMLLAHNQQMQNVVKTEECKTHKELMVLPNLPRFLRGGDHIAISTKVISMLDKAQIVNAKLVVIDANTGKRVPGDTFLPRQFELLPKGQTEVSWMWQVPENIGAVIIRIYAQGEKHQDAEEHMLPVLSPMVYLTNTYPFTLYGNQHLKGTSIGINAGQSMQDERFTFEIVSNPLWYVVQAMPNYHRPNHPSALSWAYYYFVQSMGKYVVDANPEIEHIFAQWLQNTPEALNSKLQQNKDLKTILLQQTPWVLDAENEAERKRAIAGYFKENQCTYATNEALNKLSEMQHSSGAWSWYEGMDPSPFMTANIMQLIGELQQEKIIKIQSSALLKNMCKKAIGYLDQELKERYAYYQQHKLKEAYPRHLMSARALFLKDYKLEAKTLKVYDYFLSKWQKDKDHLSIEAKRVLAEVLYLSNKEAAAKALTLSIADHALKEKDGAMYWRDFAYFRSAEQQARTLLLFKKMKMPTSTLKAMEMWLLKQKRTQDWGDNTGTAWACFAMLKEAPLLSQSPVVTLWVNGEQRVLNGQAGSAYYKQTWVGTPTDIEHIKKSVKVEISGADEETIVFGAFYRQGFVPLQAVEAHQGGMALDKTYLLATNNDKTRTYTKLSNAKDLPLGSTVMVRLHFKSEQTMDYVHLSDMLPSGFEVKEHLSSCMWKSNLFFYRAINDQTIDFFISHLPKGEYTLDYELNVSAQGELSVGPANIQSAYAPEFGAHSKGSILKTIKSQ